MSTKHLPATGQSSQSEQIQSNPQPSNGHSTAGKSLIPGHSVPSPTDYAALLTQLARKERDLQILAHRLAARETELAEIKASRGWRWLGHFWHLRNEIVLPAFRPFLRWLGKDAHQPISTVALDQALLPEEQVSANFLPGIHSKPNAFDVLCFPIIEWDFRFQRPQQLMTQFAAAGTGCFIFPISFAAWTRRTKSRKKRPTFTKSRSAERS